jgi:hypothetical protein
MSGRGGARPGAGRPAGIPNKFTTDVKELVLSALDGVGGKYYLMRQAEQNPSAFMSLLGRIIPTQIIGANGKDLIPLQAEADPHRIASAILSIIQGARKPAVKEPVLIEHDKEPERGE